LEPAKVDDATRARYARISAAPAKVDDHAGLSANEKE